MRRRNRWPLLPIALSLLTRRGSAGGGLAVTVLQPVVTFLFQFESQLFAAFFDNSAGREHVYEVRRDVIEQTLIVRDQNHGLVRIMKFVDAFGHDSQRIDVQT